MTIKDSLERVWNAALDASHSLDFRHKNRTLDEEKYLRYQSNIFMLIESHIRATIQLEIATRLRQFSSELEAKKKEIQ